MDDEIRFGSLTFIADDSAWLQEAPLDVEALPIRGSTHFRADARGILIRQESSPSSFSHPVARVYKRSSCS